MNLGQFIFGNLPREFAKRGDIDQHLAETNTYLNVISECIF